MSMPREPLPTSSPARIDDHSLETGLGAKDKSHNLFHDESLKEPATTSLASTLLIPVAAPSTASPSNIIPLSQRKGKRYLVLALKTWWAEAAAIVLALASLAGILVTTLIRSGKPLPDWRYGLSVNAVIAIFSAILKSAILFVCGEGLSHLKWRWFQNQSRPLHDLSVFDSASRGPAGASQLIWILRGKHWVTFIGASLTILLLALDPFSQQIVHYYDCNIPSSTTTQSAKVPRANYNWDTGQTVYPASLSASIAMQGAINSGVFSSELAWKTPVSCPTGNCTFADFSTIGYCSYCSEVTSKLTHKDLGLITFANDTYSNGTYVNATAHMYNVTFPSGFAVPVNASGGSYGGYYYSPVTSLGSAQPGRIDLLLDPYYYAVWNNLVPGFPPKLGGIDECYKRYSSQFEKDQMCRYYAAVSCFLYPCVKTYSTRVQEGVITETVIRETPHIEWTATGDGLPAMRGAGNVQVAVDLDCLTPSQRSRTLDAVGHPLEPGQRYIYDLNSTLYDIASDPAVNTTCVYGYSAWGKAGNDAYLGVLFSGNTAVDIYTTATSYGVAGKILNYGNVTLSSISDTFHNVAEAMTSFIRQNPSGVLKVAGWTFPLEPNSGSLYGTVISTKTCVRVEWGYVVFPAAMVLLGAVFLVGVIVHSTSRLGGSAAMASTHDWKGDPLLLLRAVHDTLDLGYKPENDRRSGIPSQSTQHDLSKRSKKVRAMLELDESRGVWEFVKLD